jgi:K+-sensing histidine kinase KdpD
MATVTWVRGHRDEIALAAALLAPLAVAAALVPFRTSFANTASALVLVAVVVAVAANGRRMAGFIAAVSASLWFDFFLTQPYERFAITHRSDIETTISLFVVGIAVTEIAVRNRFHRGVAQEESSYVGLIYRLSELVAGGAPADRVIEVATDALTELLYLRSCRFVDGVSRQRLTRIEHDGTVHLGAFRWGVHQMGLPGRELELQVYSQGRQLGRFLMEPTPGSPISLERRVVAVAIADQVGSALLPDLRLA